MENIQRNKTEFQNAKEFKTQKVELPVTFFTNYTEELGNDSGEARQRIEKAVFYLMAIFNSIKNSAFYVEGDSKTGSDLNHFINDLLSISEMGYGFSNSILAYLSVFEVAENKNSGLNSPEKIAEEISALLNNPNVPKPLSQGFSVAMTDFINSQLEHDEFNDDMSSPEYIARHLKIYGGEKNV